LVVLQQWPAGVKVKPDRQAIAIFGVSMKHSGWSPDEQLHAHLQTAHIVQNGEQSSLGSWWTKLFRFRKFSPLWKPLSNDGPLAGGKIIEPGTATFILFLPDTPHFL
jgi:hypothetical protein